MLDSLFLSTHFWNKELLPPQPSKVTGESIFGALLWTCGYYHTWCISICCSYLFTYLFDAQNIPFPASAPVSIWHHPRHLSQLPCFQYKKIFQGSEEHIKWHHGEAVSNTENEKLSRTNYSVSSTINCKRERKEDVKPIDGKRLEKPDKWEVWTLFGSQFFFFLSCQRGNQQGQG